MKIAIALVLFLLAIAVGVWQFTRGPGESNVERGVADRADQIQNNIQKAAPASTPPVIPDVPRTKGRAPVAPPK